MGQVYRALQLISQKEARPAQKVYLVENGSGLLIAKRALKREADILAEIAHPFAVRQEGTGRVRYQGRLEPGEHLLLEYIDGVPLNERAPVPLAQAIFYGQQLSMLGVYLAANRLAHGDMTPYNIVTRGNLIKVIDWESWHRFGEKEWIFPSHGRTRNYAAPEVHFRRFYPRSEVYSLGLILYECLHPQGHERPNKPGAALELFDILVQKEHRRSHWTSCEYLIAMNGLEEAYAREELRLVTSGDVARLQNPELQTQPKLVRLLESMLEIDVHNRPTMAEVAVTLFSV